MSELIHAHCTLVGYRLYTIVFLLCICKKLNYEAYQNGIYKSNSDRQIHHRRANYRLYTVEHTHLQDQIRIL